MFKSQTTTTETAPESAQSGFENVVIYSDNVPQDLAKVAARYGLNPKQLDFRILAYKTLYRTKNAPKYNELTLLEQEKFFNEENLRNPNIEIKQKIKIEIFLKKRGSALPIKFSMGGNKELTRVVLKVPEQEDIPYSDDLHAKLVSQIDIRKARLGLMIGFIPEKTKAALSSLISDIQVNEKVSQPYQFTVCEGLDPIDQHNGELILHYLQKEPAEIDDNDRVDHSKRDFMHTVEEGELVIEVLRSREGRPGRNCKGEIIDFAEVELSDNLDVKVNEDFRVEEDDNTTYYYALKSGFIYRSDDNRFEIRDELCVDEVSFRSTGSIEASDEKGDIKINIEGSDLMRDAIGQGVKVETSEVKTVGNMGSGAEVRARKVEIGGQTHQNAKIYADDVTVHLHKGYIEGKEVRVNILENGKIEAERVYVEKVSGGEIIAKEVYLKEVLSNVTVYASQYIEIDILNGNGNKFIIDPKCMKDFKERVEKVEDEIGMLKEEIKQKTKKVKVLRRKIQSDSENIRQINETVLSLKKRGATVPLSLINKLKNNQENIKEHNSLLKELKDDKMRLEQLEADLKELINAVFNARVVNRSVWKEFNEVKFKVVEPPVEVSHLFVDGEMSEEITIKSMEDGKYVLERKRG
jgi:chaperonin cofactor prefoldin